MVCKQTMIKFYKACGYSDWEALNRAGQYINLQAKFEWARDALAEMTEEDEKMMINHICKQPEQSDG